MPDLDDLARLGDVRAELAEIEALGRQVADLTAALRTHLAPEHFRLAWAPRDAVECHAIAEGLLRDRMLEVHLARELPAHSAALQAIRRRLLAEQLFIDDAD